ncbi:unnamed protein product [Rotaria sp. Silwood2]|nr:unnamed protein product [Rotaria sp. Silwood2]CAF4452405.1 unnamed protein product [Rotaria sp. Silwood2]
MANVFGSTVSFVINPSIVSKPSNLPYLLYFHLTLALVAGVLTLVYFPAQPPKAPSPAAEVLMSIENNNPDSGFKAYMKGLRQCIMNPSFLLLAIVGGVMTGTFGVWTSLFSTILAPENYTEQQAGEFRMCAGVTVHFRSYLGITEKVIHCCLHSLKYWVHVQSSYLERKPIVFCNETIVKPLARCTTEKH